MVYIFFTILNITNLHYMKTLFTLLFFSIISFGIAQNSASYPSASTGSDIHGVCRLSDFTYSIDTDYLYSSTVSIYKASDNTSNPTLLYQHLNHQTGTIYSYSWTHGNSVRDIYRIVIEAYFRSKNYGDTWESYETICRF